MRAIQENFDTDTNELINRICDTFNTDLRNLADKYGDIYLSIRLIDNNKL